MNLFILVIHFLFISGFMSCTSKTTQTSTFDSSLSNGVSLSTVTGSNVIDITVGNGCVNTSSGNNFNIPCISIDICEPSTTNCQTVSGLLLDTGSTGVRIFSSAIANVVSNLTPVTYNNYDLGNCITYGDNTVQWGQVMLADVILGELTASNLPIQVINSSSIASVPSGCYTSNAGYTLDSASTAIYNGIIGVRPVLTDCGSNCVSYSSEYYFTCNSSSCTESKAPLSKQVTNPVSASSLGSSYNNGFLIRLPSVETTGNSSINGYFILGIGTESNNTFSLQATSTYSSSDTSQLSTFAGYTWESIFDTGTNTYLIPSGNNSTLSSSSNSSGYYEPTSALSLSATIAGVSNNIVVSFQISEDLFSNYNPNYVFSNIGAPNSSPSSDTISLLWGLPFFMGRNVGFVLQDSSSTFGTGPLTAF